MKKYKVVRNTWGYKGRYWEEGTEVTFDDDDTPPRHFTLVGESQEPPVSLNEPKEVDIFSSDQTAMSQVKFSQTPKTGFAHKHPDDKQVETKTASKQLQNKKKE